ncbi:MAG: hypothetical protein GY846_25960 [Deltaproteobacteria bacterium]|jgi:hypothetical protein|nr:hypothetical protein [Deltaproteobacteria bacterium]
MPVVDSKERNSTRIKSRALSNVQMELIKLYSTNLGYDDLLELKNLLANHFAQKAINEADNVWNKKGLSENTMEDWLNEA